MHLKLNFPYKRCNVGRNVENIVLWNAGEESNSSANKCLLKVAQYAAQLENYQKAIQIYEQVASSSLDNSLLKYSAKEYFFRAALCHLCIDLINAQHALKQYEDMYPAFQVSPPSPFSIVAFNARWPCSTSGTYPWPFFRLPPLRRPIPSKLRSGCQGG